VKRLAALPLLLILGCSRAVTPPLEIARKGDLPKVAMLAVVPVTPSPTTVGDAAAHAPGAVSTMIASAAAGESVWALVPSAKVKAAFDSVPEGDVESRAGAVAAKVGAGAALTAIVRHYAERKGSDYGASDGATVSLRVLLVPAGGKSAVWSADYSIHQVPLTYNLWNFWEVQRGGLRWHTADDLAAIGIQEAVKRLAASLP
jgi:hypothetical protein